MLPVVEEQDAPVKPRWAKRRIAALKTTSTAEKPKNFCSAEHKKRHKAKALVAL